MKKATCLCGKVIIEINEFQSEVETCHCSMCRKWGSGPQSTIEVGRRSDIRIQSEDLVTTYKSSDWAERGFCSNCGSNLYYHLLPTDSYSIPIDLFDDQEDVKLTIELYYDQKPKYYDFANDTKKLSEDEVIRLVEAEYFGESEEDHKK